MSKESGFTLIEVMIAAIILFSALALTAELFKNSTFSADKAAKSAQFYQIHPAAISAIKSNIRLSTKNNKAEEIKGVTLIMGITYEWQAVRLSYLPRHVDFDDVNKPIPQFGRYIVNAKAIKNGKTQEFTFEVATW